MVFETEFKGRNMSQLAQDGFIWRAVVNSITKRWVPQKTENFLTS
jgi:hypothetical protein